MMHEDTSPASNTPNIFALTEAHLLGQLDEAQTQAFNALLLNDADARKQCALAIDIMSTVHEEFRRREENAELNVNEPLLQDLNSAINDLLRMEQQAEVIDHPLQAFSFSEPPRPTREDNPSVNDLIYLAGYLSAKAIKSRPAKWLAAAAAVLVGVTLSIVLSGNDNTPEIAITPDKPAASAEQTPRVSDPQQTPFVATLTAEHNAKWSAPAGVGSPTHNLTPGTTLAPGQRLNLTQGVAEITTNRGAVAILEAPATIELTNSDNAIRLHAGKLVGICETASSKGFVVRTPHMEITDLGTRFGIVAKNFATEVHVLEGEVQAQRADAPADNSPITLVANQSARTTSDNRIVARIDHDAQPFVGLLPGSIELTGTGQGLAIGEADPDWRVVMLNGQPIESRDTLIVSVHPKQAYDPQADSHWLLIDSSIYPQGGGPVVRYTCHRSFVLPDGVDPDRSQLVIRCIGDHILQAIRVNGQPIDFTPIEIGSNGMNLTELRSGSLTQGLNTIEIDITELLEGPGNVSGLRAEFHFETASP